MLKSFPDQGSQGVKNHAEHAMLDPTDPEKKASKGLTLSSHGMVIRQVLVPHGVLRHSNFNDVLGSMYDTTPMLGKQVS